MKDYKVINGISFDQRTPTTVCNILANCCGNRNKRVRIFLGDATTGKDWFECYNTIGYIGRSTGPVRIPLLIPRKDSLGGSTILDYCIVKITIDKEVIWQHKNYHAPIEQRGNELYDTEQNCCIYRNTEGVEREHQFFLGLRNSH